MAGSAEASHYYSKPGAAARNIHAYWLARRAPAGDTIGDTRRPIHKMPVPGRNDPCPCGSGKKFKYCHGAPKSLH